MHVQILRVTISQTYVGHWRTRAYLKSNAVLLNFHVAPCSLVRPGTVERSRHTRAVLGQSSRPFPERGDSSPVLSQNQWGTESAPLVQKWLADISGYSYDLERCWCSTNSPSVTQCATNDFNDIILNFNLKFNVYLKYICNANNWPIWGKLQR